MHVLGVNALFHDPAAALVVDGQVVAAAEEERFSRRKHGKRPVPFAAWELPELAMRWCLDEAGLRPDQLDAVAYSFDPALAKPAEDMGLDDPWDHLRRMYAESAPGFLTAALPGLHREQVRFVPHHVAHAASAALAAPLGTGRRACSVLVLDGRGEQASHLAGHVEDGRIDTLAAQALPHSLGLLYESLTEHLGFLRSSDEFKVMALASYGRPRHLDELRSVIRATGDGGFHAPVPDWSQWVPRRAGGEEDWPQPYADLACSVQAVVEEVLVELATWLHGQTGDRTLTMAGGVA
ncbi:MAG: carbamoyltransferase N-terminal domain-containing protein, partial [Phycicoccus sp.]